MILNCSLYYIIFEVFFTSAKMQCLKISKNGKEQGTAFLKNNSVNDKSFSLGFILLVYFFPKFQSLIRCLDCAPQNSID